MNTLEAVFGSSRDIMFSDPAKMIPDELRRYMEMTRNAVPQYGLDALAPAYSTSRTQSVGGVI